VPAGALLIVGLAWSAQIDVFSGLKNKYPRRPDGDIKK